MPTSPTYTAVNNPALHATSSREDDYRRFLVRINLGDPYATGGLLLCDATTRAANAGINAALGVTVKDVLCVNPVNGGHTDDHTYFAAWNNTTAKLMLYTATGAESGSSIHVEASNGANMSAAGKSVLCEILAKVDLSV